MHHTTMLSLRIKLKLKLNSETKFSIFEHILERNCFRTENYFKNNLEIDETIPSENLKDWKNKLVEGENRKKLRP